MVAGQHRHYPRPGTAYLHDDAAGAGDDVGAPHGAQVGPRQPGGARSQADQPGRAHPACQCRLGGGQGEEAVDLRRGMRGGMRWLGRAYRLTCALHWLVFCEV